MNVIRTTGPLRFQRLDADNQPVGRPVELTGAEFRVSIDYTDPGLVPVLWRRVGADRWVRYEDDDNASADGSRVAALADEELAAWQDILDGARGRR